MLYVITGPMFSGKTTELIRLYKKLSYTDDKLICIKLSSDVRYNKSKILSTFDKFSVESNIMTLNTNKLIDKYDEIKAYDHIFIDEGQFFEDLIEVCLLLQKLNKNIYISYLNLKYNLKPFDNCAILLHANEVKTYKSVCNICKNPNAMYTDIKNENIKNNMSDDILIGSDNEYINKCINCIKES